MDDPDENSDSSDTPMPLAEFKPYNCTIHVPCASPSSAQLLKQVLDVDKELSGQVSRTLTVQGSHLIAVLEATELRLLRASASSFFDMAMTAVRVQCEFDQ